MNSTSKFIHITKLNLFKKIALWKENIFGILWLACCKNIFQFLCSFILAVHKNQEKEVQKEKNDDDHRFSSFLGKVNVKTYVK